ncbi:MAG TPA: NAD(P)-binding protein, partial [Gemmatimonadales bacterium]|nr:NAD(P)-binding protein [Gemmatimonadales bacterium]
MELNAATAADGTTLTADIGIVGAGPAGLALAHQLQARGQHVLLLESGGSAPAPQYQELNAGETAGDPYDELRLSRCRAVGGTAAVWNTMFQNSPFA